MSLLASFASFASFSSCILTCGSGSQEIKKKVEGIELEKQQLLEEATGIQAKYDEVFMETEHTQVLSCKFLDCYMFEG